MGGGAGQHRGKVCVCGGGGDDLLGAGSYAAAATPGLDTGSGHQREGKEASVMCRHASTPKNADASALQVAALMWAIIEGQTRT
jgi:hypothetical protein